MNKLGVQYEVHVENIGWMPPVKDGATAGTIDQSLRIEAIRFALINPDNLDVHLLGNPHIENLGWTGFVGENEICGTVGQSLKLQALQFALRGADADKYAVQARAENVQNVGEMDWVTGEGLIGTVGGNLRLEALEMMITDAGVDLGNKNVDGFKVLEPAPVPQAAPVVPGGNLSGKIICINPGHGGSDPGACGDLRESDMNLTVALRLGQLLEERGAQVVYTRTTDDHVYLSDRPVIANNAGADIFVSIHHNGSEEPDTSGTCAICYPDSDEGIRLATSCLNGLYNRLGLRRIGLIQRDDSDVTYSDMPAVITEASFASCPADCALFNAGGAELEALGILDGILAYFG